MILSHACITVEWSRPPGATTIRRTRLAGQAGGRDRASVLGNTAVRAAVWLHGRAGELAAGARHVIRMKVPDEGITSFVDLVRGEIQFENRLIDDQVLMKSDGFPTYHLAVVVDDHLMEITHVLRGEEWISSTPKHILLYQFFGWEPPLHIHTPLLLNDDRSKISKRKSPDKTRLEGFRDRGFLPEALLNFLALLGWSHPEGKEIFSLDEFIALFHPDRLLKAGSVFDMNKLIWMNGVYMRALSIDDLTERLAPYT